MYHVYFSIDRIFLINTIMIASFSLPPFVFFHLCLCLYLSLSPSRSLFISEQHLFIALHSPPCTKRSIRIGMSTHARCFNTLYLAREISLSSVSHMSYMSMIPFIFRNTTQQCIILRWRWAYSLHTHSQHILF